ncbi:hypothetical protein PVAG01_06786 [Phlyctema vagabunda]|uniref:Extracellular membrane protein CFEM domain-containing protein n=1 Tax=Phlyctema vagabunda TaxID=108571 RepID=A0ABR4PH72_9HELO
MQYPTTFLLVIATLTSFTAANPQDTDDRIEDCGEAYVTCVNNPGAVIATCARQRAECLGFNPTTLNPSQTSALVLAPTDLADTCEDIADRCRAGPGANQATCSAQYAACLAYNPYSSSVAGSPSVAATPSSATPPTVVAAPGPAPTSPGRVCGENDIDDTCTCEEINEFCREAPGADVAACNAALTACLASGTVSSIAPAPTFPGSACGENDIDDTCTCEEINEFCREAPGADIAACNAALTACLASGTASSVISSVLATPAPGPTDVVSSVFTSTSGTVVVTGTRTASRTTTGAATGTLSTATSTSTDAVQFEGGASSGMAKSIPLAVLAVGLFALF